MKGTLIVSCEHAGQRVPEKYRLLFSGAEQVLNSHRGWDPGARELAISLAGALKAPFFFCDTSRLIIEPNRSLGHPQLYSEFTQSLSEGEKQEMLEEIYWPYRKAVEKAIDLADKPVIHLSIHTFTPVLNGVTRNVDVGLLFDPSRKLESEWCTELQMRLSVKLNPLNIKFNEPYQGIDDGFTTFLRTKNSDQNYAGIEIEVNQKFGGSPKQITIIEALTDVLKALLSPV
jgi:predicted N-formylglutamate amidohydrolase